MSEKQAGRRRFSYHCTVCDVHGYGSQCWLCRGRKALVPRHLPSAGDLHTHDHTLARVFYANGAIDVEPALADSYMEPLVQLPQVA